MAASRCTGRARGYAAGVLSVEHWPELAEPLMVVALSGWVDAGVRRRGRDDRALRAARRRATSSASIDLADARRPAADPSDRPLGRRRRRVIDWPRITFECGRIAGGREGAGRDVVLVRGPEPSLRWPTVASTIVDAARRLGVRQARDARRAFPRSCRTAGRGRARDGDAAFARAGVVAAPARLRGPTGLQTVVLRALGDAGIPVRGLWAQVPQYVVGLAVAARDRARCSAGSPSCTTSISTCARSTSAARRTCDGSRPGSRPGPT